MSTYAIYFDKSGVGQVGLTPTFVTFLKVSDGTSPGAAPGITEVGGGFYKFDYNAEELIALVVDSNDATMDPSEKRKAEVIGPNDGQLQTIGTRVAELPDR